MRKEEKAKMMDVLVAVDTITAREKKPAKIVDLIDLLEDMPAPTVYSRVDRAVKHGLLNKMKDGANYKATTLTLRGYKLLEKEAPQGMSDNGSINKEAVLDYSVAYSLLSEVFLNSADMDRAQKETLLSALNSLVKRS